MKNFFEALRADTNENVPLMMCNNLKRECSSGDIKDRTHITLWVTKMRTLPHWNASQCGCRRAAAAAAAVVVRRYIAAAAVVEAAAAAPAADRGRCKG